MCADGDLGEFNRAQRAVFNWHETLPLMLVELLLIAAACGPVAVILAGFIACGRVVFAFGYTRGVDGRILGYVLASGAQESLNVLMLILAVRGLMLDPGVKGMA